MRGDMSGPSTIEDLSKAPGAPRSMKIVTKEQAVKLGFAEAFPGVEGSWGKSIQGKGERTCKGKERRNDLEYLGHSDRLSAAGLEQSWMRVEVESVGTKSTSCTLPRGYLALERGMLLSHQLQLQHPSLPFMKACEIVQDPWAESFHVFMCKVGLRVPAL